MFFNFLKAAFRNIKKQRIYFFINLVGLALGISASVLIALFVADELSYDQFHKNADKILRVTYGLDSPSGNYNFARTAPLYGPTLKDNYPEVEYFNRFKLANPILKYKNEVSETEKYFFTDENVFKIFSFKFIYGDANSALKQINSIVLSETKSKKLFGNENPVGKAVILGDNSEYFITGVFKDLPNNSHIKINYLSPYPDPNSKWMHTWGNNTYYTYLKLNNSASVANLQSKMPKFVDKYFGLDLNKGEEMHVNLQPITDIHLHSNLSQELEPNGNYSYVIIFGIVSVFLLLIASINFVNLSTARSAVRAKEVGLRKVIGADRKNLIIQFISESIFMTVLSSVLAFIIIEFTLPYFNSFTGKDISINYFDNVFILPSIILFVFFLGTAAGIYPAFVLSSFKPVKVLSGKSSTSSKGFTAGFRKALVVAEFVISITLITSTLFISSQIDFILSKDTGFSKEQVLLLPFGSFNKEVVNKFDAFRDRLLNNSEISFVTMSGDIPGDMNTSLGFHAEGMPESETSAITAMIVEPDFLKTYEMQIVAGRDFNRKIKSDYDEGIIINESAVKTIGYKSPQDAIGKKFEIMKEGKIIGVVKDFNFYSLHKSIEPLVISYWSDWFGIMSIKLNTNNLSSTIENIKNVWADVFPGKPFNYSFFEEDFNKQYQADQNFQNVFFAFSMLTIFIACLGILGLISFSAQRRTKEIGIRKVLGASESKLAGLLIKDFIILVLAANIVSLPIIYFIINNWLEDFAYKIDMGITPFLFGGIISLAIAFLTVSGQAIKASLKNPVDTLRCE